jgi:predicted hydrocarbon binding protein
MNADFRQRLTSDLVRGELRDGDTRYVMLREDSLRGLFRRLSEPARADALKAFAASVTECGARSAARYLASDGGDLLATIEATSPQLGWGTWRFSRAATGELNLEVENSPFAHGYGTSAQAVCAPITGMLVAVAAIVFDAPAQAAEHVCASAGGTVCRFSARVCKP